MNLQITQFACRFFLLPILLPDWGGGTVPYPIGFCDSFYRIRVPDLWVARPVL